MTEFSFIIQNTEDAVSVPLIYIEVFVLMLTSFLIGYLFAFFAQKAKYHKKISLIKKRTDQKETEEDFLLADDEEELEDFILAKSDIEPIRSSTKLKSGELDFERLGVASAENADDLQKIIGIGPYTEEKLNTIGIYTFEQISRFNSEDIELVTELIQFFPDRIKNDQWISKAKMLLESKRRTQLRREGTRMKRA